MANAAVCDVLELRGIIETMMSKTEHSSPSSEAEFGASRRALLAGAAWAVPVVALATAVPLASASPEPCSGTKAANFLAAGVPANVAPYRDGQEALPQLMDARWWQQSADAGSHLAASVVQFTVTIPEDAIPGTVSIRFGMHGGASDGGVSTVDDPDGINSYLIEAIQPADASNSELRVLSGYTRNAQQLYPASATALDANTFDGAAPTDLLATNTDIWHHRTVTDTEVQAYWGEGFQPGKSYTVTYLFQMEAAPEGVDSANDDLFADGPIVNYEYDNCSPADQ